jgi:ABC-2 family transporter protein
MTFSVASLSVVVILLLIQVLAALPWLVVVFRTPADVAVQLRAANKQSLLLAQLRSMFAAGGGGVLGLMAAAIIGLFFVDRGYLDGSGRAYAAVLQLQLTVDFFILFFVGFLRIWPKGAAVAQAAFREGVRQPMFWLLLLLALFALTVSPFIPYFTFGEDHIMMKDIGYDFIMLFTLVFGTLAASMSITEEIEGRTAVTLMSKPVSRRQFLLGKFAGILLAALFMYGLLGCYFEGVLLYKHWWDRLDPVPTAPWLDTTLRQLGMSPDVNDVLRGLGFWIDHTIETLPGLVLSFCQVMVLVAVAVTLATRLPMVVNLSAVVVIYFLAHLTPVLLSIGEKAKKQDPNSGVAQILSFMSQLFDTLLPGLDFFRIGPALASDVPLPAGPFFLYVGSVAFYGLLYTLIVLLLGLILFEDRDLA